MNAYQLMLYIYGLVETQAPSAVKKVFHPGKPAGPFSQNLPAVTICTGDPSEEREYPAEDICVKRLRVEIHAWTRDPYEKMEQRSRGSYETLYPILLEIAGILEADQTLDGRVNELESLDIYDAHPGHGWVLATYLTQERR